ncbi:Protein TIC 56 [Hibiscus syriacus]|uniref:Protein TIC 56 n=1 Tax=Hibiscus syriacus TaxID=106335 RepID=A0A6A2ZZJ6_HIBSY|nr:Protein TIC 56 [Hibiscus syriacus]
MLDQFFWECENLPDYRHTPEFLARAEEIADEINRMELKENEEPYRKEDKKLWQAVPHVIGLDGRPMPREAIKTREETDDKFWDFTRQFFLGLWGFRQRPYPPGRPIDVAQAIGYKRLETRYYDFITRSGGWRKLAKVFPGLRPWEVLSLEQAMDDITYGGEWYREPLGTYHTGPPYIRHCNKDVKRLFRIFYDLSTQVYDKLHRTVPGFDAIMEKIEADSDARDARRKAKREAQKKAEFEAIYGRRENYP